MYEKNMDDVRLAMENSDLIITQQDVRKCRKSPLKARQCVSPEEFRHWTKNIINCQIKREVLCKECSRKGGGGCPYNVK